MTRSRPLIAIIDDDASVCRALQRLVRSLGFESVTFSSGEDFLELMLSRPAFRPDCVVLDVHMPGMTGLEVQQRLTGLALPVIFITAHDDPALRKEALAAGAVAILSKPFNDETFVKTLQAAMLAR